MNIKKLDSGANVVIVGLGLIGGSYAKALTKKGYRVRAITKEQKDIDHAVANGFLESGSTEVDPEILSLADVLVLALYPHTLLEWAKKYSHLIRPGTLVTDVTGVKGSVVCEMQSMMPPGCEFIAAHPMAGRERSGVEHSDDSVFAGANYIVVPTGSNTPEGIGLCKQLGSELGFARISELDVETHDKMIAFLSQLTHCIAVSLMCATDMPGLEAYTGDSFRDLTRIAKINDRMWSELFIWNKDALIEEMDRFASQFELLRQKIIDGDTEGMREMMRTSTRRREKFDK